MLWLVSNYFESIRPVSFIYILLELLLLQFLYFIVQYFTIFFRIIHKETYRRLKQLKKLKIRRVLTICHTHVLPSNMYLFKVNDRNARKRCEICSKLTRKIPEWRQWHWVDCWALSESSLWICQKGNELAAKILRLSLALSLLPFC